MSTATNPVTSDVSRVALLGIAPGDVATAADTIAKLAAPFDGSRGREYDNPWVREVAYRLAVAECDPEPMPDDYSDDDAGRYADASNRWLDVVEAIAADKEPFVRAVLEQTAAMLSEAA